VAREHFQSLRRELRHGAAGGVAGLVEEVRKSTLICWLPQKPRRDKAAEVA
jgi:hypothetical protein